MPRTRPRVYLASPFGFSASQKAHVLPLFIDALTRAGCDVYEPFSQNEQNGLGPSNGSGWAFAIAKADARAVVDCDAVFAVINGVPPDEGVCVELGVAVAVGKPYFLFRDDWRRCSDRQAFSYGLIVRAPYIAFDHAPYFTSTSQTLSI